jgi:hypothetical protein
MENYTCKTKSNDTDCYPKLSDEGLNLPAWSNYKAGQNTGKNCKHIEYQAILEKWEFKKTEEPEIAQLLSTGCFPSTE